MLINPDIEGEMFAPAQDHVAFVNPHPSRNIIQSLLADIPARFAEQPSHVSALGASLRGALALLARRGGQVVMFLSSMCSIGPGVGEGRLGLDEGKMYDTDREKQLFKPSDAMWADLADEMAEEGVGVFSIVATGVSSFVDFASLGMFIPQMSPNTSSSLVFSRSSYQHNWR